MSDSIYSVVFAGSSKTSMRLLPHVVADSGALFIQFFKNKYLRLERRGSIFCFVIPGNLPNMYDLMAMEAVNAAHAGYAGSLGSLLLDLAVVSVAGMTDQLSKNAKIMDIKRNQASEQYRLVCMDLYSGDFIFQR